VDYVKALRDRVAARRGAGKGSTPPAAAMLPATGKRPYGEEDDLFSGAM
jgi:hypothetical protein